MEDESSSSSTEYLDLDKSGSIRVTVDEVEEKTLIVVKNLNQSFKKEQKEQKELVEDKNNGEDNYKKFPKLLLEPNVKSKVMGTIPPRFLKPMEQNNQKSNSTSTVFVDYTIGNPILGEILLCLSKALYYGIKQSENKGLPPSEPISLVFSEEMFPLDDNFELEKSPSAHTICHYLTLIFNGEKLSCECAVMALAYVDRLLSLTNLHLHASNWRRIALGAIIVASKVWEDQAVWNVDFLSVFPYISVEDLNRLERQFLNGIKYMVTLKSSVYTKYYLDIRSLSKKKDFPMEPLSDEQLKQLEIRTQGLEDDFKIDLPNRSKSEDIRDPDLHFTETTTENKNIRRSKFKVYL